MISSTMHERTEAGQFVVYGHIHVQDYFIHETAFRDKDMATLFIYHLVINWRAKKSGTFEIKVREDASLHSELPSS